MLAKSSQQHIQNGGAVDATTSFQHAWDAPAKTPTTLPPDNQSAALLNVLYERIVRLEQQHHEKDAQIARLTQAVERLSASVAAGAAAPDPRYSGGVLVWRIDQFSAKVAAMRADPNTMFYSAEAFTSAHGYRYCVRINCSPRAASSDWLGLHVHLMRSANDAHLEWPFRGRIKISAVHPARPQCTKNDIIMSKPEILAFQRPEQEISPRGFGFLEWASVQEVVGGGFVEPVADVLLVKVQVTIV